MKDDRVPKKAPNLKHKGRRNPGRPKFRWQDDDDDDDDGEDPRTMGIKRW